MIEQRQKEFTELSARAEAYLERPNISLPHHKLLLRLWHYPSFDRHISWLVYSPLSRYLKSDSPLVREVVWDRPFDSQRFSDSLKGLKHGFSLEPTLSFRQAEIPPDELMLKLANLKKIVLPVFVDDGSVGLDGESFGVETFGFKSAVRFVWWSEGYEEWKPLVDWAEDMRRFLSVRLERQPLTSHAT
jgi:hypothetical protein